MNSVWDDPELSSNSNYIKFEEPGTTVTGTVLDVRKRRFDDGKVVPELIIRQDDGDEVTLTAGQFRLQQELAIHRPEPGDRIGIRYDGAEKLTGGKTLKLFTVQVNRGADAAPAAAPAQDLI